MLEKKINREILSKQVVLIDMTNTKIGIVDINKALSVADDSGLDLVQMNDDDIPVCKMLNYQKYLFEMKKAMKKMKKPSETKDLMFRPNTFINDLNRMIKQAQKFIEDEDNVRFTVRFKGREVSFVDNAIKSFDFILNELKIPTNYNIKKDENVNNNKMVLLISK